MKKKINVQGIEIRIEPINQMDYISLTDIAKQSTQEPRWLITNWLRNNNTLAFLEEWERVHNPNFNSGEMTAFKLKVQDNKFFLRPKSYIKETNAIGLISKAGRYGGTYAHQEVALNFCYWMSPPFQVWLFKKFQELMKKEYNRQKLEWDVKKITDNIDEIRNVLDNIEGQNPNRNRLLDAPEE